MILKEAYRYQNYLTRLINEGLAILNTRGFITTTKQVHNRKKTNPDAENEDMYIEKPYAVEYTPNQLIDFMVVAIREKQKLSEAIEEAKKNTELDIDSSLSINKVKQDFMECLRNMSRIKSSEKKLTGQAYKFNAEGNQVQYQYEVIEKTTIDFNRNDIQKLYQKYQQQTGRMSTMVDQIEVTTEVNYTPKWDIDTFLEDAVLS